MVCDIIMRTATLLKPRQCSYGGWRCIPGTLVCWLLYSSCWGA